ncbi:MAG: hypothetical protein US31_C0015G0005 [Berkelbacteria bacterium GW2011_GWA1_36_9]|uniref:Uncharacterized protein n=1 Tax=Berkelbacteria bacterium GW2011_GWA1_36_9 TaxID=1618331 RepID=A0A0G0I0Q5_9BACT|nr:MAG: hypothetical protein US31_C0015G0005 [Berkelbacteria bacterium GW2011_GWA1_36_9]
MSGTIQQPEMYELQRRYLERQACVVAVRKADLPPILKAETEQFIRRNVLPDCGRVPPNCLKAFMIKTTQRMGLADLVPYVKTLFRAEVGFRGYYLDNGKLFHINTVNNQRQIP